MSPLSELVWSPDDGLSIKIAASSLSTRKASLRWNAETLNIVISSPQQSGGSGKSGDNIDATLGDAEKMPSQLRTRSDSSVRVSTASPNKLTNLDAQQSTSIRSLEQDSKCCGGISLMNEGKEVSDNCCVDKLEKEEELGSCPTRCCKDDSHSSASRKEVMHSTAKNQVCCATTVHAERSWADNAWRARLVKAISQRDSVLPKNADNLQSPSSFGNLGNAENIPGKLTGFLGNKNDNLGDQVMQESHKDEPIVARCESASGVNPVARCESASGVNPFSRYKSASGVNSVAKYGSTSGVNPRKLEKGKEKVMCDKSNCVSNTKESDDSNESIESCPCTKAPKRKHVQCSTAETSSGNKRFRREDNESSCSGLLHRNGSSFFNWMSSLTNGLTVFNETTPAVPLDQKFSAATGEEFAAHPLPLQNNSSIPLQSVGFNSLFQSLYSHNVMITSRNTCHQSESNCTECVPNRLMLALKGSNSMLDKHINMGRETLDVATETLAADSLQMGSGGDRRNFQNQIGIFPLRTERNLKLPNSSKSCSRSLEGKQNEFHTSSSNAAMRNKGGFTESLWVSRFLPKTSMKLMDATPHNEKRDFGAVKPKVVGDKLCCSSMQNINMEKELKNTQYFTSEGSDNGTTSSKCPAMPREEHKQSETMASTFAKRLDALRHAKTSAGQLAITCDHGMSKARNRRTSSFVVSYSSHDGLETGQGTHKSSCGDGRLVLRIGDKGKEQLCTGSDEELRGKVLSECEYQHCGGSTAGKAVAPHDNVEANKSAEDIDGRGVKIKEGASNSMESLPDNMESLPDNKKIIPYGIMSNDVCDEPSVVFGALQRLRLSRSDIIRWLRSPIMHTTLDGFFLRLRFGKWEEALGGTGYHVVRINGALDRNLLSVTIRNSTCQVYSRFVSNRDFHEDELKAWWSAAMKGGWKLPSKEELIMKLRERDLLHF